MAPELLQQIPRAVEQDRINTLLLIACAFVVLLLQFAFTLCEETKVVYQFFVYAKYQWMTKPAYVDYFAKAITYPIIFGVLAYIMPKYREYLFCIMCLFIGYVFEYKLIYNDPIAKFHFTEHIYLPIGYSTFALTSLIGMFVYRYLKK